MPPSAALLPRQARLSSFRRLADLHVEAPGSDADAQMLLGLMEETLDFYDGPDPYGWSYADACSFEREEAAVLGGERAEGDSDDESDDD